MTSHKDQKFEAFNVRPYARETLTVGSDIVNVKSIPYLAVLDPVKFTYGDTEMTLGHAIHPMEYFAAEKKCSTFAVGLPIGWVLSGPLHSSSSSFSTSFTANLNSIFNWLVRLSHGTIWNLSARTSRLTRDSQRMLARKKYLKQQFFIVANDTMSVCCGLMTTSSSRITNFRHC